MGYKRLSIILIAMMLFAFSATASGENIDPDNDGSQYAWGENVGWINMEPSWGGVTVSDSALTGMAWGENIGWINLSPANGGVLNDGNGNLSGYAWGENIGWINFNPTGGGVAINPATGVFSGYAWGENIGWINFEPATGEAKTSWRGAVDNCPSDPNKTEPGICGCGVADTDTDGDGTPNCNDSCPNDPNKTSAGVCGCGVADTDSDGDGYYQCINDCNDSNASINPSAPDVICDGIDNNCNGTSDENYAPPSTACGQGVCASTGQLICVNGSTQDTCTAGQPTGTDDNCNGIDENCSGIADDGYLPTSTACGVGVCSSTGLLTCVSGTSVDTCNPGLPQIEICNGLDDNCDGNIDEGVYVFGGFQQPINADGSSIFNLGRTIPVKIILTDCSGQSISTATVTIAVYKISNAVLGNELEQLIDSSGNANTGNLFRYDAAAGQYIYNLSTKGYTKGTYKAYATPDNGQSYSVVFSLK